MSLQSLYDSAQTLQQSEDVEQAAQAYKKFLSVALQHLAENRAYAGDYAGAKPLFDSALMLAPRDEKLKLSYAEAARVAKQLEQARLLAQQVVDSDPKSSNAHFLLGRVFLDENQNQKAKEQLEAAVKLEPDYRNGYTLATAELALQDIKGAAQIFREMLAGFGDTAAAHMDFGKAYGESGYPEQAIPEFKIAIHKDDKLPGAHYSLGASYLLARGDVAIPDAAAEFQRELQIQPNDYFSLAQLGAIAMKQHHPEEAESDLTRATSLNAKNPDNFLLLAQVEIDLGKSAEAEAALRKAIALTTDPSRNHYQVQRAHYLLGRVLIKSGKTDEARKEMQISQSLLQQNIVLDHARLQGESTAELIGKGPVTNTVDSSQLNTEALKASEEYEQHLAPAIADSFNNIAVTAARDKDYKTALICFQQAAFWNAGLDGLDYNWARAAYSAGEYSQALSPLQRYLKQHPNDPWARSSLGISLFMTGDNAGVVRVVAPIESQLEQNPPLSYAYAESLVRTGHYDDGIARLKSLSAAAPDVAVTHRALGVALLGHGEYSAAEIELRTALRLNATDSDTKYQLALALIQLGNKTEAETILTELSNAHFENADTFYQLGRLKLAHGDAKTATLDFETAVKLSPDSAVIHQELMQVYQQQSRNSDLDREIQRYQAALNQQSASKPVAQ